MNKPLREKASLLYGYCWGNILTPSGTKLIFYLFASKILKYYGSTAKYHENKLKTLPNMQKYQKLLLKVAGRIVGKRFLGQVWASITGSVTTLHCQSHVPVLLLQVHLHLHASRKWKCKVGTGIWKFRILKPVSLGSYPVIHLHSTAGTKSVCSDESRIS